MGEYWHSFLFTPTPFISHNIDRPTSGILNGLTVITLKVIESNYDWPINHFICTVLIEGVIKPKGLIFQVFGKVDLLLRLMYNNDVFVWHGNYVHLLLVILCIKQNEASLSSSTSSTSTPSSSSYINSHKEFTIQQKLTLCERDEKGESPHNNPIPKILEIMGQVTVLRNTSNMNNTTYVRSCNPTCKNFSKNVTFSVGHWLQYCVVPRLLNGLFRRQTQIWWFSIGSDADNGRKSSFLRYSLKQI